MAQTKYIISLVDRVSRTASTIQGKLAAVTAGAQKANAAISSMGLLIGGAVMVRGISKSIDAWDKQEQAIAQVRAGLEATGAISGKTLDGLKKQARDLQKNTLFGDESIMKGVTSQILTFTNITGDAFDRTQRAVLDVTTKLFGAEAGAESLRSTSIQLAKALNDPVANLGALGRSGIQFSEDQKKLIKTLAKTGRVAESQAIILGEIEKQYGGAAAAAAKAGKGGLIQLQNRFGDIAEVIGGTLFPMIEKLSSIFERMATWIENNREKFERIIKTIVTFVTVIGTAIIAIKLFNFVLSINPISLIIIAIAALVTAIIQLWKNSETFRGIIFGVWEILKGVWRTIIGTIETLKNFDLSWQNIGNSIEGFVTKRIEKLLVAINLLGDALRLLFEGEYRKAADSAAAAALRLTGIESLFKLGKKAGKVFQEGFAKGGIDGVISSSLAGVGGIGGSAIPSIGLSAEAQKLQAKGVVSGGIKTFNINIQQVTGIETLSTTNIEESAEQAGNAVVMALTKALADVKNID